MSGNHSSGGAYSFSEVVSLSGATESNLTHWARSGLIVPDARRRRGSGHHRSYAFRNVVEAAIANYLNAAGMSVAQMKAGIAHLKFIDDASAAIRDGDDQRFAAVRKRWEKLGYCYQPDVQGLRDEAWRWRLAKTPRLRERLFAVVALSYSLVNASNTFLFLVLRSETLELEAIGPAHIFISISNILTRLELATGAAWEGALSEDEMDHIERDEEKAP